MFKHVIYFFVKKMLNRAFSGGSLKKAGSPPVGSMTGVIVVAGQVYQHFK